MNTQMLNLIGSIGLTVVLGLIILPILKKFKIGQPVRAEGPESHLKKNRNTYDGWNYDDYYYDYINNY